MYVLSKETTLTSLADLQIGSQLTQDYKVMITSRPVLQQVITDLNLEYDYEEFKEELIIENPKDTRILQLSIETQIRIWRQILSIRWLSDPLNTLERSWK